MLVYIAGSFSGPLIFPHFNHTQVLNDWLDDKPWIVQSPNWFLRSLGAPIFLNNPISGVFILVALYVHDPWVATSAVIGLVTAIITAVLLKVPKADIANGGATFHGMLTAIVIATSVNKPSWYPWLIFPVIAMATLRYRTVILRLRVLNLLPLSATEGINF